MTTLPAEPVPRKGRPRWVGWAGFILGVLLLIGAGVVLFSDPERFRDLIERLRGAPWWAVAFIMAGPVFNWLLVSACLWMLLRRHGRLGLGEMNALVGSAWLLNHLPMRPGLIGRVGYHKLVNGIRVRDAIESTLWSLGLAGLAGVMAFTLAWMMPAGAGVTTVVLVLAGPVGVVGVLAALARAAGWTNAFWLLGALAVRYADMGIWAARYAVVFWVMGVEVTPVQVVMVTAVSQVAQLVPIAGGGMGLREWLVGLTAGSLFQAFDAALAGDLINRAVETLIVVPVGLISGAVVARRIARFRAAGTPIPAGEGTA
ncbi:MAG: hypothetical protein LAT64_09775 [Phycisphaerales bacterium]|nr:hypothetical protein [Planctomycetota bacterium]MCH8509037.1 hypothetical protein [Phycisphaerales bacterium]